MPLVLLAEPDAATSELYQRALRRRFTVLPVADHQRLRQLLDDEAAAALILEPTLFGDEAWDAVARIAEQCRRAGTVLIICSTQDERRRGFSLGVNDYLLKPTLPEVLTERLLQLMTQLPTSSQA